MKYLLILLAKILNILPETDWKPIPLCNVYYKHGVPIPNLVGHVTAPVVTTQAVSSITALTATGNGNVTDTGSENPSVRGVAYSTSNATPTTADSTATTTGGGTGAFTVSMTGLAENQHYYVRAYATNSAGTGYGSVVEFTTSANPPTVTLSSPADTSSTTDTTPDLVFTGTDSQSNDIRYNVQVDTVNTFDSVGAGPAILDSYSETNVDSYTNLYNVSTASIIVGQAFTNTSATTLGSAKFYMRKSNSPPGNIYCKIYNITGTFGTDAYPSGTALATSDAVATTAIPDYASPALVTFSFSGAEQISLSASTNYIVTVEYSAGGDITNYISVGYDSSSSTHDGNLSRYSTDFGWVTSGATDYVFYVYSNDSSAPLLDKTSGTDAGFSGSPDNTDPFTSGQAVTYTVQSALSADTYYWRVRGIDPSGSNTYGAWSSTRSFTVTAASNYSGTPGNASLTLTAQTPTATVSDNKAITLASPSSLTLTAQTPTVSLGEVLTPNTASLTTSLQTPTATATDNKSITLATPTALTTSLWTPTVTATDNIAITLDVASLTLTAQTPSATVTNDQNVTPGTASLTLTAQSPSASLSDNKDAVPGTASLTLTAQTPTVALSDNKTATPDIATLTLSPQTPLVKLDNRVTPGVLNLTTALQTPTADLSDNKFATPDTASLSITAQTPTLDLSDNKAITLASPTALTLSPQTPTVDVTSSSTLTPGIIALTTTNWTPTVAFTDNKDITLSTASFTLTPQTPTVEATDNKSVTPGTASLTITGQQPSVLSGDNKEAIPGIATLTLTAQTPTVSLSDNKTATPDTTSLTLSPQTPTTTLNQILTPGVAEMLTVMFAPSVSVSSAETTNGAFLVFF